MNNRAMTLRPTIGSYLAFCGIWIALSSFYVFLAVTRPSSGAWKVLFLVALVAAASVAWLNGHRILISSSVLSYRNGFYKTLTVPIAEISEFRHGWKKSSFLGREIESPCLFIASTNPSIFMELNIKPFSLEELRDLEDRVHNESPLKTRSARTSGKMWQ